MIVRAEVRGKRIARVTARFLERPSPDEERLAVRPAAEFPWGVARVRELSKRFGTALDVADDGILVVA